VEFVDFTNVMWIVAVGLLVVGGVWVLIFMGLIAIRGWYNSPRLNRDISPVPHTRAPVPPPRLETQPAPPPEMNP
jgi:hypothetical protein